MKNKINSFYNNEYELLDFFSGYQKKLRLKHVKCGHTINIFANNLFINKSICTDCNKKAIKQKRKTDFLNKIKEKYKGKFVLISEYNGTQKESTFKCTLCNTTFEAKGNNLLHKNRLCPNCDKK